MSDARLQAEIECSKYCAGAPGTTGIIQDHLERPKRQALQRARFANGGQGAAEDELLALPHCKPLDVSQFLIPVVRQDVIPGRTLQPPASSKLTLRRYCNAGFGQLMPSQAICQACFCLPATFASWHDRMTMVHTDSQSALATLPDGLHIKQAHTAASTMPGSFPQIGYSRLSCRDKQRHRPRLGFLQAKLLLLTVHASDTPHSFLLEVIDSPTSVNFEPAPALHADA